MPPKRKGTKRKAAKTDELEESPPKLPRADSENTQIKNVIESIKQESSAPKSKSKVDKTLLNIIGEKKKPVIHEDFACMLNQTNVVANNNKFYVIQIAKVGKTFYGFTKWGRVGEDGANKVDEYKNAEEAEKNFKKKFQDKTGNKWDNRANFEAKTKKYTLLEMDDDSDNDDDDTSDIDVAGPSTKIKKEIGDSSVKCKLDERTRIAIELLFNQNMFLDQMVKMDLDVRKMPLGKLSKVQVAKGLEALIAIEEAVKKSKWSEIPDLTSKFFTLIPHNFGRNKPPVLNSLSMIQSKKEVMMTLSDIALAQSLSDVKEEKEDTEHPLDVNYKSLDCPMKLLNRKSKEFTLFQKYVASTQYSKDLKLVDVWELDRNGEAARFSVNNKLGNRKLLWHGTSVAVVAAILNSGLRIMPHSGGRVGRGIYLASEYSKSAGYCGAHYNDFYGEKSTTFMFLTEAVLGNPNEIGKDNSSLKKAPQGFDSVIARGSSEPDPKKDETLKIDGKDVIVPVGKPIKQKQWHDSYFDQSEYLLYNEHQARLRYLLKFVE